MIYFLISQINWWLYRMTKDDFVRVSCIKSMPNFILVEIWFSINRDKMGVKASYFLGNARDLHFDTCLFGLLCFIPVEFFEVVAFDFMVKFTSWNKCNDNEKETIENGHERNHKKVVVAVKKEKLKVILKEFIGWVIWMIDE